MRSALTVESAQRQWPRRIETGDRRHGLSVQPIKEAIQVMRTLPKILAALAFLSSPALAFAEAGAFAEWLSGDQPECIPLGAVTKAADDSVPLNGDQFQFVRALFVAIPPVSDDLPPGDRAALFLDGANKAVMVGIIDRDWVCARFTAPDSLVNLIIEVGKGEEPDSPREDRGSNDRAE
jgi:hypothetical protein